MLCMYVCTYMYPARLVILSLGIKGSYWSTYIHYVLGYNTDLISDVPCIKRLLFFNSSYLLFFVVQSSSDWRRWSIEDEVISCSSAHKVSARV